MSQKPVEIKISHDKSDVVQSTSTKLTPVKQDNPFCFLLELQKHAEAKAEAAAENQKPVYLQYGMVI